MPPKLTICLFAAAVSVAALTSHAAAAREYEIEVIVFDRLDKEVSTHEQWDFSSPRIAERLREMTALADAASTHPTSDRIYRLAPLRTRLLESGYRILDTTRWRQPPSFYQHAPLIPLGNADADATALGVDRVPASGFVRIYTTSLIYADLNLQLSPLSPIPGYFPLFDLGSGSALDLDSDLETEASLEADLATQPPHYFIAEKRRLKFKQIHYFDHPLFGAILGVWPVDATTPEVPQDKPADEVLDF